MVVSILIPSRRPSQLIGFFDSLEKNTKNFSNVEVIVKIDDDQPNFESLLEQEVKKRPFSIRYKATKRHGGQFTLWLGLDELFNIVSSSSYFVMAVTDEARIITYAWDEILKKYVGFFQDDIFRLKISLNKLLTQTDLFSCVYTPESFPIFTKKWLDLTEGFGDCYGGDAYHQLISYHLLCGNNGVLSTYKHNPISRDVPLLEVEFSGFEFGKDVGLDQQRAHSLTMLREWLRLLSWKPQTKISYLAKKIFLSTRLGKRRHKFVVLKNYELLAINDTGEILDRINFGINRWFLIFKLMPTYVFLLKRIMIVILKTYKLLTLGIFLNFVQSKILRKHSKEQYSDLVITESNSGAINFLYNNHKPQGIFSNLSLFDVIYKRIIKRIGYVLPNDSLIMADYKKFIKHQILRSKKYFN